MNHPHDDLEQPIGDGPDPEDFNKLAYYKRKLEFRSGPENHTFYACQEHKYLLDSGDVSCFFAVESQPTEPNHDGIECDFCREG